MTVTARARIVNKNISKNKAVMTSQDEIQSVVWDFAVILAIYTDSHLTYVKVPVKDGKIGWIRVLECRKSTC